MWRGAPTLLLTMTGRRTGTRRRTALIYGQDGDSYVVVASKGGAPKHPAWFLNLQANPEVEIQVGPRTLRAKARVAEPDDKARLWPMMTRIWPAYEAYQKKTDRDIPVVVLDPVQ
jgi:deazaflavin-dependent oxidoreductase (nitroreductase family)